MADDLTTKLVLELIDKATAPLKEVQSALKELTSVQKSITKSTTDATAATTKATKALNTNTAATERDIKAKNKQKSAVQELGQSLVELGEGLEIKNKLQEILEVGKEYQSLRFKLSAVLGVDMANKDLDNYITKFKSLAASGLGSYDEVANTGYALFSAGLDTTQAMQGTAVALKVARITSGNAEDVANIMATASKDFKVSMVRVGDVFTKAQIKFQIKDFQQLEEGLKYVAATAASVKMPIEQATTVLGALNNAGKNGSMAGTGFNEIINKMGKVDKQLKITVPRMKNGSMDFIKWSQLVTQKIKEQAGSSLDAQHVLEQKMFGIQGGAAFAVLINYMKELPGYLDDIKNHSQGIVETNIAKYYQTFAAKTVALHSATTNLYNAIATSVIPMFTGMLNVINPVINALGSLISQHQWLGKVIFITAGALAAFLIIAGANKLMLKPMIETVKDLGRLFKILRINTLLTSAAMLVWKGVMLVANSVMKVLRLTTLLFNAALWANPLTWIIAGVVAAVAGLAFAVYEVIKHWSKIKTFFTNLWGYTKTGFTNLVSWIKSLWGDITKMFDKVINWFKGGKKTVEIKGTVSDINSPNGITASKNPNSINTNASNSKNGNNVTYHNTFHIHGSNADPKEIAHHVTKILKQQHTTAMAH